MTEYQFKSRCPDFIQKGIIFIMTEKLGPCLKIGRVFLLSSPILFFPSPLIIHIVIVLNTLPTLLQSR